MIPAAITQQNILDGIEKTRVEGYDARRESDDYDLWIQGKTFPPKVVISKARYFFDGIEHPASAFNGGHESNQFLIERGFPIVRKDRINSTKFFAPEELAFLEAKAGKTYDRNNPADRNAGAFLNQVIWQKCGRWADHLCAAADMKRTGSKTWNEQRYNTTGQAFKAYAWYRLNPICNFSDDVFYTVGIESSKSPLVNTPQLVIKLDCRRNKLPKEKQQTFDTLLDSNKITWRTFPVNYPETGSWEDLVAHSIEYIRTTRTVYNQASELFRPLREQRFARLVWNTRNWVERSGQSDKSEYGKAHENSYGYGHEEWLFDTDKEVDGFVYGRIQAMGASSKFLGNSYDLYLFTHKKDDGWKWIGCIKNVEAIGLNESSRISKLYRQNRWLQERLTQLAAVPSADVNNYEQWPDSDRFNLKYKAEDIELYDERAFSQEESPPTKMYSILMKDVPPPVFLENRGSTLDVAEERSGIDFNGSKPNPGLREKIIRIHQPKIKEIENVHGALQKGLVTYLRNEYGNTNVDYEARKFGDNSRIDVVLKKRDGTFVFYEIKSYPSVRHSIRVAIGQLFEYSYFGCPPQTNDFVIVSHLPASAMELDYLSFLTDRMDIHVSYMEFDMVKGKPVST